MADYTFTEYQRMSARYPTRWPTYQSFLREAGRAPQVGMKYITGIGWVSRNRAVTRMHLARQRGLVK
jgi:hypothetical protein